MDTSSSIEQFDVREFDVDLSEVKAAFNPELRDKIFWNVYSYILPQKVAEGRIASFDVDSYFRGDPFSLVEQWMGEGELFLVDANHPKMWCPNRMRMGAGMTAWQGIQMDELFVESFYRCSQETIFRLFEKLKGVKIRDPRCHFVYPFQVKKWEKEDLDMSPCYFHLHRKGALEHMELLKEWFG